MPNGCAGGAYCAFIVKSDTRISAQTELFSLVLKEPRIRPLSRLLPGMSCTVAA